jgi:hypothetical protein
LLRDAESWQGVGIPIASRKSRIALVPTKPVFCFPSRHLAREPFGKSVDHEIDCWIGFKIRLGAAIGVRTDWSSRIQIAALPPARRDERH